MNRLDELLEKWCNGVLADTELGELNRLLDTPEARARLRETVQFEAALLEGLRKIPRLTLAESVTQHAKSEQAESCRHFRFRALDSGVAILRHWLLPLAACFVAMAGVAAWLAWRPVVGLEAVQGAVTVLRDGKVISARDRLILQAGDVVRTAPGASARVQWRNEATQMDLQTDTETRLISVRSDKHLTLLSGTLTAQVAKQAPQHPMVLETRYGRVVVLGTQFELSIAMNKMRVEVSSGRVLLAGGNRNNGRVVETNQSGVLDSDGNVEVVATLVGGSVGTGLIAHWPLTEGTGNVARDVSGNGLDATIQNPKWITNAGRGELIFSDVLGVLPEKRSFVRTPELNLPSSFTITVWVRPDQTGSIGHDIQALFANTGFGGNSDGFYFLINRLLVDMLPKPVSSDDHSLTFRVGNGRRDSRVFTPPQTLKIGQWHFLAVEVNQNDGRLDVFVDGVAVIAQASIAKKFNRKNPLLFGAAPGTHGLPLAGSLRDIRIYERLLNADEISHLAGK